MCPRLVGAGERRAPCQNDVSFPSPTWINGSPPGHSDVLPRLEIHTVGSWIAPHRQAGKFDYRCQIKPNRAVCVPALGRKSQEQV